jgi:hypothetical protein
VEIIEQDNQKMLTSGGAFYLPLAEDLGAMMTATKALHRNALTLIVRDAGLEAPDALAEDRLQYTALSIVQNAWYEAVKGGVPANIQEGHRQRVARHLQAIKELGAARKSPTTSDGDLPVLPAEYTPEFSHQGNEVYRAELPQLPTADNPTGEPRFVNLYLRRPGGHAQTIEEFRERKDNGIYTLVLDSAGYKIPWDKLPQVKDVYPVAAGVVQRWWHAAANKFGVVVKDGVDRTPTVLPEEYERDQRLRYLRCLRSVEKPEAPVAKMKLAKEPRPPKERGATETTPKQPRRATDALVFRVKTPTEGLKAAIGQVYAAVVLCGETAPLQAVIDAAVTAGFTTKEPSGPGPRVRWLALELCKKNILEVVGQ